MLRHIRGIQHETGVGIEASKEGPQPTALVIHCGAEPQPLDSGHGPAQVFGTHHVGALILIGLGPGPFADLHLGVGHVRAVAPLGLVLRAGLVRQVLQVMQVEEDGVHLLSHGPEDEVCGRELPVLIVLHHARQAHVVRHQRVVDDRRHQSLLVAFGGGARHLHAYAQFLPTLVPGAGAHAARARRAGRVQRRGGPHS